MYPHRIHQQNLYTDSRRSHTRLGNYDIGPASRAGHSADKVRLPLRERLQPWLNKTSGVIQQKVDRFLKALSHSKRSPLQRADSPRPRIGGSLIHDVFKPKFPLDPFVKLHTIREPWVLRLDAVAVATGERRRDVLLILGAPTLEDITPVLHSSQLSGALIILASHELLSVPTSVCAATCLIRLNTPVTNGRNDSLRFAAILQCAEHISRVWRKNGGSGAREIKEPETGLSPSSVPANLFLAPGPDSMSSPARLSIISSVSFFASSTPLPPPDPSQRAFDAILNFIPDGMNDLAVMKQSILVTSLSRPYLTPAYLASSPSHKSTIAPSRRSIFRRKSALPLSTISPADSFQSVPTPLPKSHILHILPGAGNVYLSQENLLRSMESFQLSFAYPPSLSMKRPGTLPHAVAFIVPVAALREVVRYTPPSQMASHTSLLYSHDPSASSTASSSSHVARQAIATEWTVVDILLSGVLDVQANPGSVPHAGPRAWIGGAADVSFTFDIESESASRSESVSSLSCSNEPLTPTSDFPGHGLELEQVGRDGLYDGAQVYPAEDIMDENAMEKDGVVLHETVLKHPLLEVPIKLPLTFGPDYPLSPSSSDDSELGAVQLTGQEIVEVLRSH